MTEALHTKYRPQALEEVIGQLHVTQPLARIVERRESQAFLFVGPSGTGKTTLARIIADMLQCRTEEIPAARYTGVDDMRKVMDTLQYQGFGTTKNRALILDEAHRLSKQAWDSILIDLEQPPDHVYWFFCTTEMGKIPAAIKTRCSKFTLKYVPDKEIEELVSWVAKQESIDLPGGVLSVIVKEAKGSVREALVNLSSCAAATNRQEASATLQGLIDGDATLELCQLMAKGKGSWVKAMSIFKKLEDENAESIRIAVCLYIGKCLKDSKTDAEATFYLSILDNFCYNYNASEGSAPLLQSIGRTLFRG